MQILKLKKKLIITISFSFSIRYLVRTNLLEKLKHQFDLLIVIFWNEEDLVKELTQKGFNVVVFIPGSKNAIYENIRRKIGFWFNAFRLKSPSQKIQNNFLAQYNPSVSVLVVISKWYNSLKFFVPGYTKNLFKKEAHLVTLQTDYIEAFKILEQYKPNALFTVTPFHSQEDIFLRACKNYGLRMLTAILSFDNITKRGWIPVVYDKYMVWNKYNKEELCRIYPNAKSKKIIITGAPQFDFYWNKNYLINKNEWKKLVGINEYDDRKIILYAGGPAALFPDEPHYLKKIDDAINANDIKNKPLVLFRCHPVDRVERWKEYIGKSDNIVFDISWTGIQNLLHTNITDYDIKKLCSTLYYTDVHINLCSTMTVDGSAFNKPQIAPAYDIKGKRATHLLKQMYYQEHFLPIVNNKGVALAENEQDLICLINKALSKPEEMSSVCNKVVNEIITYSDGKSTERVYKEIVNELL